TPISGRTRIETQRLVGCFLNTIVLRAEFEEGVTFRSLVRQTRDRALSAYAHAELPFERLVTELSPVREAGRSPLLQVMFILLSPGNASAISSVSGIQDLANATSKFDLTLYMCETDDGLAGLFEYSTDLFEPASVRRLGRSFVNMLAALAGEPDEAI